MSDVGDGLIRYSVDCGTYNEDLIDMIVQIARNSKPSISYRDDEVLDELLEINERLTMAEVVSLDTSESPYYFSDVVAEAMEFGRQGAFG